MPPAGIDELVKLAQTGDRAAFREIVLALENDLRFFVGAFEISDGLAEEVVQATFVTAFQKLALYRGEGAFSTWLRSIARNHLLKTLQEQKRFTELTGDTLEGLLVHSGLEDIDRMEELETQTRKLRSCMERLPGSLHALVQGRYMQGLSTVRLAEQFQRTEIWVRVTLCRIRKALR